MIHQLKKLGLKAWVVSLLISNPFAVAMMSTMIKNPEAVQDEIQRLVDNKLNFIEELQILRGATFNYVNALNALLGSNKNLTEVFFKTNFDELIQIFEKGQQDRSHHLSRSDQLLARVELTPLTLSRSFEYLIKNILKFFWLKQVQKFPERYKVLSDEDSKILEKDLRMVMGDLLSADDPELYLDVLLQQGIEEYSGQREVLNRNQKEKAEFGFRPGSPRHLSAYWK